LIASVGRLAEQKGFDLLAEVMPHWLQHVNAQWVVLGTGDAKYHGLLSDLAARFPQKIAVKLEFSNELAHRIEAGADMFVMPSRYEPCGLNQLYSLKYGTVPVVRSTGGLADTITDCTEQSLAEGTASGFSFEPYTTVALEEALQRARSAFANPVIWQQLIQNGMQQDWSWANSARQYDQLYARTLSLSAGT